MRVFNEKKTQQLYDYDLSKGYLKDEKLFIASHKEVKAVEGKYHYEVIKKYPNGGRDMAKVWDIEPVEGKKAYDEYEDIQVYIPYTQKQLAEIEINELKKKLSESDYKAIKYAEGQMIEEEYLPIKIERQSWRDRINYLENL